MMIKRDSYVFTADDDLIIMPNNDEYIKLMGSLSRVDGDYYPAASGLDGVIIKTQPNYGINIENNQLLSKLKYIGEPNETLTCISDAKFNSDVSFKSDVSFLSDIKINKLNDSNITFEYEKYSIIKHKLKHNVFNTSDNDDAKSGWSVNSFGNQIIIGAPYYDSNSGAATIYNRNSDGTWEFQVLLQQPGTLYRYFGTSVFIDEKYAIIGCLSNSHYDNIAAVFVYEKNSDGTLNTTPIIIEPPPTYITDFNGMLVVDKSVSFGCSVLVNNEIIVVGAKEVGAEIVVYGYGNQDMIKYKGTAWYYTKDSNGNWKTSKNDAKELYRNNPLTNEYFGSSLAMTTKHIAVGAPSSSSDNKPGYVCFYSKNSEGTWDNNNPVRITAKDGTSNDEQTGSEFGFALAINYRNLVISAPYYGSSNTGAVYVYNIYDTGIQVSTAVKLEANDKSSNDKFGASVSIHSNYIMVGADHENSNVGSVYLYISNSRNSWTLLRKIRPNVNSVVETVAETRFGTSISMQENYAVVGASGFNNTYIIENQYIMKNKGTTETDILLINGDDTKNIIQTNNILINGDNTRSIIKTNTIYSNYIYSTNYQPFFIGHYGLTISGTLSSNKVDINGGNIDGTAIGVTTASSGKFTTLEVDQHVTGSLKINNTVKIGRNTNISPPSNSSDIACTFSNGSTTNTHLRAYINSLKYLDWGYNYDDDYGFMKCTGSSLELGDGAYQLSLSSSKATVDGDLFADSLQSYLTGIDTHHYSTRTTSSIHYASICHKNFNNTQNSYSMLINSYGKLYLNAPSEQSMSFRIADNEKMVLDKNGNLGIGTDSPGDYKLFVNQTGSSDIVAMFQGTGDTIVYIKGNSTGDYDEVGVVIQGDSDKNEIWFMGTDDEEAGNLYFAASTDYHISGDERKVAFTRAGYIGIGTSSPRVPLHVDKAVTVSTLNAKKYWNTTKDDGSGYTVQDTWWFSGGDEGEDFGQGRIFDLNAPGSSSYPINNGAISAMFKNNVWFYNGALLISSDKRIKENIIDITTNIALEKLRKINCYSYRYKDKVSRGYTDTIGFIAQQVNYEFPISCKISNEFIPDVYQEIVPINWEKTETGQYKLYCDIKDSSNNILDVSGIKYKFIVTNNNVKDISNTNLNINETVFSIIGNSDNSFTFDDKYNNVFCYGKEVDDFHTLDKQKIFTLNVAATKDIDRIQQQQLIDISQNTISTQLNKTEIDLLKLKNEELKQENEELKTELNIVKLQNQTLQERLEAIEKRLLDANI